MHNCSLALHLLQGLGYKRYRKKLTCLSKVFISCQGSRVDSAGVTLTVFKKVPPLSVAKSQVTLAVQNPYGTLTIGSIGPIGGYGAGSKFPREQSAQLIFWGEGHNPSVIQLGGLYFLNSFVPFLRRPGTSNYAARWSPCWVPTMDFLLYFLG